jgi:hypothetical protein
MNPFNDFLSSAIPKPPPLLLKLSISGEKTINSLHFSYVNTGKLLYPTPEHRTLRTQEMQLLEKVANAEWESQIESVRQDKFDSKLESFSL